jgi:hypothetical protein
MVQMHLFHSTASSAWSKFEVGMKTVAVIEKAQSAMVVQEDVITGGLARTSFNTDISGAHLALAEDG